MPSVKETFLGEINALEGCGYLIHDFTNVQVVGVNQLEHCIRASKKGRGLSGCGIHSCVNNRADDFNFFQIMI
jgi:hypothetical protein